MVGGCQLHNDTRNKYDKKSLILGQVDFINCFPINIPIEFNEVGINARVTNGTPSELNNLILKREIDIAPVSSIAFLENKDKLTPIGDLCIASDGPADSVLLFSKFPIEELDGARIALSHASATSNKLLEIILKEFYKIKANFKIAEVGAFHEKPLQSTNFHAHLLIGDHALFEYSKMPRDIFIYDLGSLWKKYTGLPMVFGVWVVRRELGNSRTRELENVAIKLNQAKVLGLGTMFDKVVKKAQERVLLSEAFYQTYFEHLKYEFTENCKKGLKVFEEYCRIKTPLVT